MTNDKDSAVPDPASHPFGWEAKFVDHAWRVGMAGNLDTKHDASITVHDHYEDGHTAKEIAEFVAAQYNKALRQPTQSDALLEGDTQTILYLLGVRHGREDERAKIAAEASQPTQSDDEAYDLGKRDGYEKAVQDIDMLTGGDGEYCYSTIEGERHCPNVDTMKARIARRLRQPTQSDAQRKTPIWTEAATIQTNGRWDGNTAQSDALREAVIEECANALEADAMKCDCAALEERECGCGAWCEWKSITSARAVEIVRELKKVPSPEGDGDQ